LVVRRRANGRIRVTTLEGVSAPPPRAIGFAERLSWVLLVALIIWLTFLGGGWQGIYAASLRSISLLLIAVGVGAWLAVAVLRPSWRPRTRFWPALAAGLLVMATAVVASPLPRVGADYLAYSVLLVALYLLLERLMAHPTFRIRVTGLTIVLFLGLCLTYIAFVVGDWVRWWDIVGRFVVPPLRPYFEGLLYGNPSAVMTMALLLLAPALAHLGLGSTSRRVTAAVLVVLALVVTLLSGSRAGWLAFVVGVGVTFLMWIASGPNRRRIASALEDRRVRVAAVVVVIAGVIGVVVFGPVILLRVGGGGEDLRSSLYVNALRVFQSSPLVGTGPGTWVVERPAFTQTGEIDYYIPHAHDIYVQALAEFGLLGLAAGLVVAASLIWVIRDGIRDADPVRARFGWAALFATTYFSAHQVLDFYANMPATIFAWAIPIAYLDATSSRSLIRFSLARAGTWARWGRAASGVVGVLLVVVSIGWLAWSESAARQLATGVDAANTGDWTAALSSFQAAASADPDFPPNQFALGLGLANSGDTAGALAPLLRAATTDNLPAAWLDVAWIRAQNGDAAGARDALGKSLRLGTQEPGINLGAGVVALKLGDQDAARDSFVAALTQLPSLAGDPWWTTGPAASIWPAVREQAISQASPDTAFNIALSSGDVDRARSIASSMEGGDGQFLSDVIIPAWAGDPEATAALSKAAREQPYNTGLLDWVGRVARRSGDFQRAADIQAWAGAVDPGAGTAGTEVRVVSDGADQHVAGLLSLFYGHYTYRRPVPWDQLVPGLPDLAYQ
jgi:O-antigen ligase/tetratricopeptide (TPR) repeat protein